MTAYTMALRKKGWQAKEVAARWGITPRQLSRVAKDPSQKDWDALAGLPDRDKMKNADSKP